MGYCIITKHNPPSTLTYTAITRSSDIDLGAYNNYRYLDTTNVPNLNLDTYSVTSRSSSIDMGVANSYRYLNTNNVPNSNSDTYTFSISNGSTIDLGLENIYRYVNATNVVEYGYRNVNPSLLEVNL